MEVRRNAPASRNLIRGASVFGALFAAAATAGFVWGQQEKSSAPSADFSTVPRRSVSSEVGWSADNGSDRSSPAAPLKILIMKDGRTIQGSVRADAGGYHIETPTSNMYVTFEYVKFAATDLQDAHRKMSDSLPATMLRRDVTLARWCLDNGLVPEAAEHLRLAVKADPANSEAKDLMAKLERVVSTHVGGEAVVGNAFPRDEESSQHPESLSRLQPATVKEFVTRVQPILLARCGSARCHGGTESTAFRLERVRFGEGGNRGVTSRNLEAILRQIDNQFPSQSPLLVRGFPTHGGQTRPTASTHVALTQQTRVREWVKVAAVEMNRIKREDAERGAIKHLVQSGKPSAIGDHNVVPASAKVSAAAAAPPITRPATTPSPAIKPASVEAETPANGVGPLTDPFDPTDFNARQPQKR